MRMMISAPFEASVWLAIKVSGDAVGSHFGHTVGHNSMHMPQPFMPDNGGKMLPTVAASK